MSESQAISARVAARIDGSIPAAERTKLGTAVRTLQLVRPERTVKQIANDSVTGTAATAFAGKVTLPDNLKLGTKVRVTAVVSAEAVNPSDTLISALKWGSATLATHAAISPSAADKVVLTAEVIVMVQGSADGEVGGIGSADTDVGGTVTTTRTAHSDTTVDTVGGADITVTAQFSTASGTNEAALFLLDVEVIEPADGEFQTV